MDFLHSFCCLPFLSPFLSPPGSTSQKHRRVTRCLSARRAALQISCLPFQSSHPLLTLLSSHSSSLSFAPEQRSSLCVLSCPCAKVRSPRSVHAAMLVVRALLLTITYALLLKWKKDAICFSSQKNLREGDTLVRTRISCSHCKGAIRPGLHRGAEHRQLTSALSSARNLKPHSAKV